VRDRIKHTLLQYAMQSHKAAGEVSKQEWKLLPDNERTRLAADHLFHRFNEDNTSNLSYKEVTMGLASLAVHVSKEE
jgi:hypothetical protein